MFHLKLKLTIIYFWLMFVSKSFSKSNPTFIFYAQRNKFFFSPKLEFKYDPQIKENIVHDLKFLPFLKSLEDFPLEIGKEYHQTAKSINVFSRSAYLSVMAHEEFSEWTRVFENFYKALEDGNLALLEGKVERNLFNRVQRFSRNLSGTKLKLQIIEPKEPKCKVNIIAHKSFKGVFIDRALNLHLSKYYRKESKNQDTYELLQESNIGQKESPKKIDWETRLDKELDKEYLDKDRKNYTINQFILEIETNRRMIISKQERGETKPIYGNLEEGFESHYMIIENKRDYFKKFPYYIVDFDFVLNKNPHVSSM